MVYVIEENLAIQGQPGGLFIDSSGLLQSRPSARRHVQDGRNEFEGAIGARQFGAKKRIVDDRVGLW